MEYMPKVLNSAAQPDIDKWAILLRPEFVSSSSVEQSTPSSSIPPSTTRSPDARVDGDETGVFIGVVGTNRWSDQGMETGYSLNRAYWGKGFATEAFQGFLKMYWTIAGR